MTKKLLLLCIILLFANYLQAQNYQSQAVITRGGSEVFLVVEQMPEFPGGVAEMFKFLRENIEYPIEAQLQGIQGRVVCQFIVNSDGSISDIKVVRGVHPSLDAEAIRAIESMPKWIPGKKDGEAVNVQFTVPVAFAMEWEQPIANIIIRGIERENGQKPEFPNGLEALMQFFMENIEYPELALTFGIQGNVSSRFAVETDGSIVDIEILKDSVDLPLIGGGRGSGRGRSLLETEVLRVIELMPNWIPAKQDGKAIKTTVSVPIRFRIRQEYGFIENFQLQPIVMFEDSEFTMPEFPSGERALMRFLENNIRYPFAAQANFIQGRVITRFVVDRDGSIVDIEIVQSVHPELDREAVRVILAMPKWIPGKIDGQAVRVMFTLPINFRLQ